MYILGLDASNIKAGGGLVHLQNLISHGDPSLYGIDKVVIWGGKQLDSIEDKGWLEKVIPPLLRDGGLINEARWILYFHKAILDSKCNIVFAPGGTFYSSSIPYISMSQNMLVFDALERNRFFPSKDWLRLNLLSLIQSRSLKNSVGNIFISKFAKNYIGSQLGLNNKPSTIIYHGIDESFKSSPAKNLSITSYSVTDPFKILYVSIIEEYKHQWILVEAVSRLVKVDKFPVELNLVGGYAERAKKKLDDAISKFDANGEFVKYLGLIPHNELPSIYKSSNLFAFSSSCENMPNILIEAICSGLPVVSSDYGPMVEVIGEEGLFYDPTSVDSTYKALKQAILDRDKRELLSQLSNQISQSFSWDITANSTFKFISDCMKSAS